MAGSNNLSGNESILFADNMSFDGTARVGAMSLDGQLWIGSSTSDRPNNGGHVRLGTLTPGVGVTITNAPGSITIGLTGGGIAFDSIVPNSGTNPVVPSASGSVTIQGSGSITTVGGLNSLTITTTGGGLAWAVVTVNTTFTINTGTISNKAGTLAMALPASSAVGDIIRITGINTAAGWQITQAAGQQIFFGNVSTTAGATGSLTSTAIRDSLEMVCVTANLTWNVLSSIGNITVA